MLVNVILVPDPPVPKALALNVPFNVVVETPNISPPHKGIPQPKAPNCSAGPP